MAKDGFDLKEIQDVYKEGKLREGPEEILAAHLDLMRKHLDKNKTVLDIGCGLGQLTYELAKYSKKVYGIDPSDYNVELAWKRNNSSNIEYLKGDGTNLEFEDNKFDIIVSSEVIEHVRDFDKFISEIYRVAKKGAICSISSPNLNIYLLYPFCWFYALRHPIKYFKILSMRDDLKEYEEFYDRWFYPGALKKYLTKHGFRVEYLTTKVKFSPKGYDMYFKKKNIIINLISKLDLAVSFIYSKIPFMKNICNARFFIVFKK